MTVSKPQPLTVVDLMARIQTYGDNRSGTCGAVTDEVGASLFRRIEEAVNSIVETTRRKALEEAACIGDEWGCGDPAAVAVATLIRALAARSTL